MSDPNTVHFMGIGGSGMSAVAQIAAAFGYRVSGCDIADTTAYMEKVKTRGIPVSVGHDPAHITPDVDLVTVSPAIYYQNNSHPEAQLARDKGILIKWQEFLGKYLHQGKTVICIAGTHGKSTTTALTGILLSAAGLDPTVEVGANVKEWDNNLLIGYGKYFVSEADEFDNNFSSYHPHVIILNNIEMDHPEYFSSLDKLTSTFQNFINQLDPQGILIANTESPLVHKLQLPANTVYYSLSAVRVTKQDAAGTDFIYKNLDYHLTVPGLHNVANALGIIELAGYLKIPYDIAHSVLSSFQGLSRRLELIGEPRGIFIYDDYANHPTAFAATISAVKQLRPESKIWAVIEPHTFSRLRVLLKELPDTLVQADHIIVSKIYASRETDPGDFTGQNIVDAINGHGLPADRRARYIPEFTDIVNTLKKESQPGDVILVMGSGNSYKLSRDLLKSL